MREVNVKWMMAGSILLFLLPLTLAQQPPEIQLEKTFGGDGTEYAYGVQETPDQGFIIAGYTDCKGTLNECLASPFERSNAVYILKINKEGELDNTWTAQINPNIIAPGEMIYEGPNVEDHLNIRYSRAHAIQKYDDKYIITGSTNSWRTGQESSYYQVFLLSIEDSGKEVWQKVLGNKVNGILRGFEGYDVDQIIDKGGFAITGVESDGTVNIDSQNAFAMITNPEGNLKIIEEFLNPIPFGGEGYDFTPAIDGTKDGGFVIAGWSNSHHKAEGRKDLDIYVTKTIPCGNKPVCTAEDPVEGAWIKTFGEEGEDLAWDVQQTSDGGFILGGEKEYRFYLLKIDAQGNEEWGKVFPNEPEEYFGVANAVRETSDGGFIAAGVIYSGEGEVPLEQPYIVKTDEKGNLLWQIKEETAESKLFEDVVETTDHGYFAVGATRKGDIYFMRLRGEEKGMVFKRGDTDQTGKVDLTDAVYTLSYLFRGGSTPQCLDSADANDDGKIDLSDAVYTLNYLFLGGLAPPSPGPEEKGEDTTKDELTCLV